MNTRTPSTAATLRLDLHTEATANARGKGLRTRVRAVVSAVADGDTTIQATDAKTGVAGRATVFVTGGSAVLQAIVVTPNPAKVAVGAIQEMTALGVYSDGTTKNLTKTVGWSSSRESRESRPT